MKQILSLILAITLVLLLCACSLLDEQEETVALLTEPAQTIAAADEDMGSRILDAYREVLLGEAPLIDSYSGVPLYYNPQENTITDDFGFTANPIRFCLLDLDRDGKQELLLWLRAGEDNHAGYWVLRYQGGDIWGYSLSYRSFDQLKADGSFQWSGGSSDYGIGTMVFENCTWSITRSAGYEAAFNDDGSLARERYYLNGEDATHAEVLLAYEAQKAKENAPWASFTDETLTRAGIAVLDTVPEETPASISRGKMIDILSGFDVFYDRTTEEYITLGEFLSDYSAPMDVNLEYSGVTAADLDGDGIEEVLLQISIPDIGPVDTLVLHSQYKTVHGRLYAYRELYNLKADGTFFRSGGASDHGPARMEFGDEWMSPYIDDEGFDEKEDARWVEFPCTNYEELWEERSAR